MTYGYEPLVTDATKPKKQIHRKYSATEWMIYRLIITFCTWVNPSSTLWLFHISLWALKLQLIPII